MQRRHITTAITLVLLCGILVLGLVVGYKSLFSPLPGSDTTPSANPTRSCTSPQGKGNRVRTSQVQVSVFNGGTRSGLAGTTLHQLARRGFQKGDVGNAPANAKVKHVQVWTTEKHDAAAKLVALQFGDKTKIQVKKTDLGPGVDVVVGDGYHGLVAAPRVLKVGKAQRLCLSSASPSANS
jgi:LytR cell envelope-related transcriptional attenuator